MTKEEVRASIGEIGIVPSIRVSSSDDALFAAEAVAGAGIPIVEVTMTVPGALKVIAALVRSSPSLLVGAGTILDVEAARHCLDAGAQFLTSTGFERELVDFAVREGIAVFPGALTPTEIIAAWKAGADFVKVFPCAQVGGPSYIRSLRRPLPQVPLIAAGGVNQQNAGEFIQAGADALGIGGHLIPQQAIELRQPHRIQELARRFSGIVKTARNPKDIE